MCVHIWEGTRERPVEKEFPNYEGQKWPDIPWQAVPADGITGHRTVGLLEAVHRGALQARFAFLKTPVLLEPVRTACHALGILPVAKAAFLQGLTGNRMLVRQASREKTAGIKGRPGLIITECRPSWIQRRLFQQVQLCLPRLIISLTTISILSHPLYSRSHEHLNNKGSPGPPLLHYC